VFTLRTTENYTMQLDLLSTDPESASLYSEGGGQGYFRELWLAIIRASWFVIWRNNIPWIVINMRAVNCEEPKGLARVLNLPISYSNLWMWTFKTQPKFNINVKKINKFASRGCLSWSFFVSSQTSFLYTFVPLRIDFVNHHKTFVIFRNASLWLIVL
jgi:hypothetical protein